MADNNSKAPVWFFAGGHPKAVVLVAHGLNLNPAKMDSIARQLQADGADALRLTLTGHDGNLDEFKKVTRESWASEFRANYGLAHERAAKMKVPLYLVGFSLGGVLGLDLMTEADSGVRFDRMILLAPAVSLKKVSYLLNLMWFMGKGFCVPSRNLPEYRANHCTPLAGYRAVLDSGARVKKAGFARINIPTIVFVDPDDDLVSAGGIDELINSNRLSAWRLINIKAETTLPKRLHHLIIDEKTLGNRAWNQLVSEIKQHFQL